MLRLGEMRLMLQDDQAWPAQERTDERGTAQIGVGDGTGTIERQAWKAEMARQTRGVFGQQRRGPPRVMALLKQDVLVQRQRVDPLARRAEPADPAAQGIRVVWTCGRPILSEEGDTSGRRRDKSARRIRDSAAPDRVSGVDQREISRRQGKVRRTSRREVGTENHPRGVETEDRGLRGLAGDTRASRHVATVSTPLTATAARAARTKPLATTRVASRLWVNAV